MKNNIYGKETLGDQILKMLAQNQNGMFKKTLALKLGVTEVVAARAIRRLIAHKKLKEEVRMYGPHKFVWTYKIKK